MDFLMIYQILYKKIVIPKTIPLLDVHKLLPQNSKSKALVLGVTKVKENDP